MSDTKDIKDIQRPNVRKSKIGLHISSDIDEIENIFCGEEKIYTDANIVQFFVDGSYKKEQYKNIGKIFKKQKVSGYIHSSFKINCAKEWDETSWWINFMIYEIKIAHILGMEGVVLHTGNSNGLDEKVALNNLYTSMKYVDSMTKKEKDIKMILETPAGQGTELLSNFDEFLMFMQKFKSEKRFGICLDTCHMFSAGIDVRDNKIFKEVIDKCSDKLGLERLLLVHLNDSKHDLGERKDRHESLGYGFIGRKGIKNIIKALKSINIPMILETPSTYHENELQWIKKI